MLCLLNSRQDINQADQKDRPVLGRPSIRSTGSRRADLKDYAILNAVPGQSCWWSEPDRLKGAVGRRASGGKCPALGSGGAHHRGHAYDLVRPREPQQPPTRPKSLATKPADPPSRLSRKDASALEGAVLLRVCSRAACLQLMV